MSRVICCEAHLSSRELGAQEGEWLARLEWVLEKRQQLGAVSPAGSQFRAVA
jgi:hypothetical protein